jgi:hypothetical protein
MEMAGSWLSPGKDLSARLIQPYTKPCTAKALNKGFSVSANEMPGEEVLLCRGDEAKVIVGVGVLGDIGDRTTHSAR